MAKSMWTAKHCKRLSNSIVRINVVSAAHRCVGFRKHQCFSLKYLFLSSPTRPETSRLPVKHIYILSPQIQLKIVPKSHFCPSSPPLATLPLIRTSSCCSAVDTFLWLILCSSGHRRPLTFLDFLIVQGGVIHIILHIHIAHLWDFGGQSSLLCTTTVASTSQTRQSGHNHVM